MNMISKVLLIVLIALGATTINAQAQRKRPAKTSSAKAYYGNTSSKPHSDNYRHKQKNTHKVKTARSQSAKRVRADARNRKKYS